MGKKMYNKLHIITYTQKGEEALKKLLEEDSKESLSNRIKVNRKFERRIISNTPLIYEAQATEELRKDLRTGLMRIAHLITSISIDTNINMFMTQLKENQIQNMKRNGAINKVDFEIKLYDSEEEAPDYDSLQGKILNKILEN